MQYHVLPSNSMQFHESSCNAMQYHAIPCNAMQCHAIPRNTMQQQAICTIQYHFIHEVASSLADQKIKYIQQVYWRGLSEGTVAKVLQFCSTFVSVNFIVADVMIALCHQDAKVEHVRPRAHKIVHQLHRSRPISQNHLQQMNNN